MMSRVVVTAAQVACPLGSRWESVTSELREGHSGIRAVTAFDASSLSVDIAAEVPDVPRLGGRDRIEALLNDATMRAIDQAALKLKGRRVGFYFGLGRTPCLLTDLSSASRRQDGEADDYGRLSSRLAERFGIIGPVRTLYTACASGNDAIGLACRMVRRGEIDAAICGAADSQVSPLPIMEFLALNVLARAARGELTHPRPFDRMRNGFVVGEGAAVFVLERLESARRRRAAVIGEIAGYGAAADAFALTRTHPQAVGAVAAMRAALRDAGLGPNQIDYINAHGTGTIVNDAMETQAIKEVFGALATAVPVSSTKSMTGHLLAASAAVELAFCLMAIEGEFVPPTLNYTTPDPACDLDYVPRRARAKRVVVAMSNAFGFGGQNSCLIVRKYD
jgi:3-oxoacyl-[acyl-carrier-protein] synthase II